MKDSIENIKIEPNKLEEMDFESGFQAVVSRIESLLNEKDLVTVGFNATGPNVGKTALLKKLAKDLSEKGVLVWSFHDFEPGESNVNILKERFGEIGNRKKVVVFDEIDSGTSMPADKLNLIKAQRNIGARELFKQIDQEVSGIDVWIGICRPDKPFARTASDGSPAEILADILINNELAVDKK